MEGKILMKKAIIMMIVLCLWFVPISSFATDLSAMSEDELLLSINQIRDELEARNHNSEMIICQYNGLTIYYDKAEVEKSYDGTYTLTIHTTSINSGDESVLIGFSKISINGWEVSTFDAISVDAGNKAKQTITVYEIDERAEIKSVDEIEEIVVYSFDPNEYDTLTNNMKKMIILK